MTSEIMCSKWMAQVWSPMQVCACKVGGKGEGGGGICKATVCSFCGVTTLPTFMTSFSVLRVQRIWKALVSRPGRGSAGTQHSLGSTLVKYWRQREKNPSPAWSQHDRPMLAPSPPPTPPPSSLSSLGSQADIEWSASCFVATHDSWSSTPTFLRQRWCLQHIYTVLMLKQNVHHIIWSDVLLTLPFFYLKSFETMTRPCNLLTSTPFSVTWESRDEDTVVAFSQFLYAVLYLLKDKECPICLRLL